MVHNAVCLPNFLTASKSKPKLIAHNVMAREIFKKCSFKIAIPATPPDGIKCGNKKTAIAIPCKKAPNDKKIAFCKQKSLLCFRLTILGCLIYFFILDPSSEISSPFLNLAVFVFIVALESS
jgi:hypothetical protein